MPSQPGSPHGGGSNLPGIGDPSPSKLFPGDVSQLALQKSAQENAQQLAALKSVLENKLFAPFDIVPPGESFDLARVQEMYKEVQQQLMDPTSTKWTKRAQSKSIFAEITQKLRADRSCMDPKKPDGVGSILAKILHGVFALSTVAHADGLSSIANDTKDDVFEFLTLFPGGLGNIFHHVRTVIIMYKWFRSPLERALAQW
ncbi:unnamed protein product, partial [Amoebophrya sp. A120]|eukprot:GSA120T00007016001.1